MDIFGLYYTIIVLVSNLYRYNGLKSTVFEAAGLNRVIPF